MSCYHPLKGYILGIQPNGKKNMRIVSYDTKMFNPDNGDEFEHVLIPCGQCIGCRIDYSKQWATRCMLESKYHDENYFITLTYDDENVPRSKYLDSDLHFQETLTLKKRDLQLFNKRLRSRLSSMGLDGFRFYACGEYGSASARPHYHMIAFGLHLDDLQLYKRTDYGNLYTSEFLSSVWKKGHVIVGGVQYESCAYVSRYVLKKRKGSSAEFYDNFNIEPEFTLMSRNPGIANQYFCDNVDNIYPDDSIVLPGGKQVRPPRYFDKMMDEIDEDLMANIRYNRCDLADALNDMKLSMIDVDYLTSLTYAENNQNAKLKKLVRPL